MAELGHRQHLVVFIRDPILPQQFLSAFEALLPKVNGLLEFFLRDQQALFEDSDRLCHSLGYVGRLVVLRRAGTGVIEQLLR